MGSTSLDLSYSTYQGHLLFSKWALVPAAQGNKTFFIKANTAFFGKVFT